jgi:hypothetical protein
MKPIRLVTLIALLTLFVAACDRSDVPAEPAYEMNTLVDYAPSDTPYLAANLAPLPDEFVDTWLVRLQPVLEEMQTQLTAARADLEQASAGDGGTTGSPEARLALALLRELDGKLNRAGLESLGLDIGAHRVLYGVGAFPVFRVGLADSEALRATVQRVLADAGISATQQSFQGVSYWRFAADYSDEIPVGLYLAILDDHLAFGILPPSAEQELLPAFLALEKPADSDARARLLDLNERQGYTPYGSGMVNLHDLADQFLQPDALTARVLAASGHDELSTLGPDCVTEIHGIIDQAPRMTAGTTELTADAIAYQYRVETPAALAASLMDMVAEVPAVDEATTRMLEFAFGMRFGAVRDFVQEKATAIVDNPFRCEKLQHLNESAKSTLERLEQPMPPFVNNFRGIRVSLDEVRLGGEALPADARGYLAVNVERPEMFVGMAQMFLPDLSKLSLVAGDPPVRLPESMLPVPDLVAFAAMTDDAIGLSLGEGEEQGLPAFLAREPGPKGVFLSASYDTAAYLDLTDRYAAKLQSGDAGHEHHDGVDAVEAIASAARTAIQATADRSLTTLRFSPDALVIEGRMTFK